MKRPAVCVLAFGLLCSSATLATVVYPWLDEAWRSADLALTRTEDGLRILASTDHAT